MVSVRSDALSVGSLVGAPHAAILLFLALAELIVLLMLAEALLTPTLLLLALLAGLVLALLLLSVLLPSLLLVVLLAVLPLLLAVLSLLLTVLALLMGLLALLPPLVVPLALFPGFLPGLTGLRSPALAGAAFLLPALLALILPVSVRLLVLLIQLPLLASGSVLPSRLLPLSLTALPAALLAALATLAALSATLLAALVLSTVLLVALLLPLLTVLSLAVLSALLLALLHSAALLVPLLVLAASLVLLAVLLVALLPLLAVLALLTLLALLLASLLPLIVLAVLLASLVLLALLVLSVVLCVVTIVLLLAVSSHVCEVSGNWTGRDRAGTSGPSSDRRPYSRDARVAHCYTPLTSPPRSRPLSASSGCIPVDPRSVRWTYSTDAVRTLGFPLLEVAGTAEGYSDREKANGVLATKDEHAMEARTSQCVPVRSVVTEPR